MEWIMIPDVSIDIGSAVLDIIVLPQEGCIYGREVCTKNL